MFEGVKSIPARFSAGIMRACGNLVSGRLAVMLPAWPGPLAACIALTALYAGAHSHFRMADEGFLWYGAQRVLAGEVPLLDFQGYDPGRYYWTAAVMALLHDHGFVAVNIAAALFGAIGLWVAIQLVFRDRPRPPWWLYLTVVISFILWMVPRVKLFDIGTSMLLVALLAWLIEQPTRYRCFMAGLGVGAAAIIGRNHGLYGAFADILALFYIILVEKKAALLPSLLCWGAGVIAGYSPMLLAIAFIPGFWAHLWATIHVYFEVGATNRAVPIPWPWRIRFTGIPLMQAIGQLLDGTLLMVLPLFGITIAAYSVWRVLSGRHPVNPVLLAAGLLAIPYSHHAFARASLDHMAQAIHPMLIGVSAITISLTRVRAAAVAGIICAISILLLPLHPLYERWQHGDWVSAQIGPDVLVVDPSIAARAALFSELLATYVPEGREYVAEPMICGAYSIFDRRAAVWDTYALFPADTGVQQWEIERIRAEHPALIMIDRGLNGRGADAYSHTHPLVYDYIVRNFMPIHPDFVSPEWHFELYVPADTRK